MRVDDEQVIEKLIFVIVWGAVGIFYVVDFSAFDDYFFIRFPILNVSVVVIVVVDVSTMVVIVVLVVENFIS